MSIKKSNSSMTELSLVTGNLYLSWNENIHASTTGTLFLTMCICTMLFVPKRNNNRHNEYNISTMSTIPRLFFKTICICTMLFVCSCVEFSVKHKMWQWSHKKIPHPAYPRRTQEGWVKRDQEVCQRFWYNGVGWGLIYIKALFRMLF